MVKLKSLIYQISITTDLYYSQKNLNVLPIYYAASKVGCKQWSLSFEICLVHKSPAMRDLITVTEFSRTRIWDCEIRHFISVGKWISRWMRYGLLMIENDPETDPHQRRRKLKIHFSKIKMYVWQRDGCTVE